MLQVLLSDPQCGLDSFYWKSQLHYSTDVAEKIYKYPSLLSGNRMRLSSSATASGKLLRRVSTSVHISPSKSLSSCKVNTYDSTDDDMLNKKKTNYLSSKASHDPLKVYVHCHNTTVPYGFEFLQATDHLSLNPQTESALFSMIQAMKRDSFCHLESKTKSHMSGKELAIVSRQYSRVDRTQGLQVLEVTKSYR